MFFSGQKTRTRLTWDRFYLWRTTKEEFCAFLTGWLIKEFAKIDEDILLKYQYRQ